MLNFVLFMFRFVWWGVRWSFATVFFLAVMAGAGYYVFNETLTGGEYVRVPNIVRYDVTNASYLLAAQGLELGKLKEMPDERVPKGHIIAQRPSAGKVVRTGRKVYPTVSSGTQTLPAPSFLHRTLADVQEEIQQMPFTVGTVARVGHTAPRNTVIAQDPAPGIAFPSGGKISFLVSDGVSPLRHLMPDLRGMAVEEIPRILSAYGVLPVPQRMATPGPEVDVVVDQKPAAGTLVYEGETVFYYVRPSGGVTLPDARRLVEVQYTVPPAPAPQEVRLDTIDRNGVRQTVFPQESDYVYGVPPKLISGQSITIPIWFVGEMTVEVFLDGKKVRSYYYKGEAAPVITPYDAASPAADSA